MLVKPKVLYLETCAFSAGRFSAAARQIIKQLDMLYTFDEGLALRLLEQEPYDLLILGTDLKEFDFLEMLKTVLRLYPKMIVCIYSPSEDTEFRFQALAEDVEYYIRERDEKKLIAKLQLLQQTLSFSRANES